MLPIEALAQHRITVEPSIEITEVRDDNLFFSEEDPASDLILRVRPALALRVQSARWSVAGNYEFDSERFADYSALNNTRAREQAVIDVRYQSSPRLALEFEAAHMDTANAAELNIETGLAASRVRAQRLTFGPSARFQISPRLSARASYNFATDKLNDGRRMRAQSQAFGIERQVTARDLFTLDYEQDFYSFDRDTTSSTNTYVLRAGWTRRLDANTSLMVQVGPRITDDTPKPELSASLTRSWRNSSLTISCLQTETTIIGTTGTVQTRNLQAKFTYAPNRSLAAYAAPAVFRNVQNNLEATVYRIGLGARYAVTPLIGLQAIYSLDSQHGAIDPLRATDPLRANDDFSHGMLSVGLTARWSGQDGIHSSPWR